jgi:hypothetical protein
VLAVGGGGGGAAGGGGAGGVLFSQNFAVTPGATINYRVGAGGVGSTNGASVSGGAGGWTSFGAANLVTNGSFDSNVSGWTDPAGGAEGTFVWNADGTATLTNTNANDPPVCVYQAITCVVGQQYVVVATKVSGDYLVVNIVNTPTTGGGSGGYGNVLYFNSTGQGGTLTGTFTATQTTHYVVLRINNNTNGVAVQLDNIGVFPVSSTTLLAIGGGGGGGWGTNIPTPGGSGGGAGWVNGYYGTSGNSASSQSAWALGSPGYPGQGHNGGAGHNSSDEYSGGGGGAGGPGTNGGGYPDTPQANGGGGIGLYFAQFTAYGSPAGWFGGGGGAGTYNTTEPPALGGYGGGGGGAYPSARGGTSTGTAGVANTGGGGGVNGYGQTGNAGGSGIILIRYVLDVNGNDPRGYVRYNSDIKDVEVYQNVGLGWCTQDQTRNFAGYNLIASSTAMSTSYGWTAYQASVATNSTTAPDGTATASKLTATTAGSTYAFMNYSGSQPASVFSIYAKQAEYSRLGISNRSTNSFGIIFDLTNGNYVASTNGTATVTNYGSQAVGNGWYRFWVSTTAVNQFNVHPLPAGETNAGLLQSTISGTYANGSGIYVWGAQWEQTDKLGLIGPGTYTPTVSAGGTVPYAGGGYRIHVYNTVGTSGFTPAVTGTVEILVVAGGGSGGGHGGNDGSGGGGAGGVVYIPNYPVTAGVNYQVVVGAGGAAISSSGAAHGNQGGNSRFGPIVAVGGGGGGSENASTDRVGGNGGSGGGAGGYANKPGGGYVFGQGNRGGDCNGPGDGGGGGAGTPGGYGYSGDGGQGLYFPQFAKVGGYPGGWFGGGGGASGDQRNGTRGNRGGNGGLGGGGRGADATSGFNPAAGVANTGGGGGGAAGTNYATALASGAGGSGVVIVRYRYE